MSLRDYEGRSHQYQRDPRFAGNPQLANRLQNEDGADFTEFASQKAALNPRLDDPYSVGMSKRDVESYSVSRAITAAHKRAPELAPLENEISRAIKQRTGDIGMAVCVPTEVLLRTLTTGNTSDLVGAGDMTTVADVLRSATVLGRAGTTVYSGLQGNALVPSLTTGAESAWVGEGSEASDSSPVLASATATPNTCVARHDVRGELIKAGGPMVDDMVMRDLFSAVTVAGDAAGLAGTGADYQPTGIVNTSGVGAVAGGSNGAAPTWDHLTQLRNTVALENVPMERTAFVSNSKVVHKLASTSIVPSGDTQLILDTRDMTLVGRPLLETNSAPSDLVKGTSGAVCSAIIFGDFSNLVMCVWGGLDIIVDPYTNATTRVVRVTASLACDFVVRRPQAFAVMLDALTT